MNEPDHPRVIGPAPVFYLAAFLLVPGLHWLWPLPIVGHPVTPWLGRAVLFIGLALNLWGLWSLKRHGTPINPYRPVRVLVSDGPFRFSRNPLYVGLHLVLFGLVLILDTAWGLAVLLVLLAVIHFGVILPEERYLEARFGGAYKRYRATIRRYL